MYIVMYTNLLFFFNCIHSVISVFVSNIWLDPSSQVIESPANVSFPFFFVLQALTHMVSVAADPKELLTQLGIASVLQDSLLETIEARRSKHPHVNVSCLL